MVHTGSKRYGVYARGIEMRRRIIIDEEEENPLGGVANLFDAAMVFAVALLAAFVLSYNVPELLEIEKQRR